MHRFASIRIASASVLLGVGLALASGCGETRRVVAVRGGLQHLEGAEGGIRPDVPQQRGRTIRNLAASLYGELPGDPLEGSQIRRVLPDQSVALIARTPSELIYHLRITIRDGEWDLLYEQLLSKHLKAAYEEAGRDPREESIAYLQRHRDSILDLLTMVYAGELTPGAGWRNTAPNIYRLTIPGGRTIDAHFTNMTLSYEDRQFKLRMINR